MSSYSIVLEPEAELTDAADFTVVDGWWVDDNVVTIVRHDAQTRSRYKLPRGKPRITVRRLGRGRSELALGGYTTTTVSVVGPSDAIDRLREAVL